METPAQLLSKVTDTTQPLPAAELILECLEANPYFSALAMAWLRRSAAEGIIYDEETRRRISLYAALSVPGQSEEQLYVISDLLEGDETDENFYPPQAEPQAPDTAEAIDRFLNNYSGTDSADKETAVLEQLIFNPTADYSAVLAAEEEQSQPSADDAAPGTDDYLLNNFILAAKKEKDTEAPGEPDDLLPPPGQPVASRPLVAPPPVPENKTAKKAVAGRDDISFSESLAKIYIRRKNYSGAKEIINKLNLKYPEKSIYFAVQLRFIDKLLLNQRLLDESKASKQIN